MAFMGLEVHVHEHSASTASFSFYVQSYLYPLNVTIHTYMYTPHMFKFCFVHEVCMDAFGEHVQMCSWCTLLQGAAAFGADCLPEGADQEAGERQVRTSYDA